MDPELEHGMYHTRELDAKAEGKDRVVCEWKMPDLGSGKRRRRSEDTGETRERDL